MKLKASSFHLYLTEKKRQEEFQQANFFISPEDYYAVLSRIVIEVTFYIPFIFWQGADTLLFTCIMWLCFITQYNNMIQLNDKVPGEHFKRYTSQDCSKQAKLQIHGLVNMAIQRYRNG